MSGCLMWLLLLYAVAVLALRLVALVLAVRQGDDVSAGLRALGQSWDTAIAATAFALLAWWRARQRRPAAATTHGSARYATRQELADLTLRPAPQPRLGWLRRQATPQYAALPPAAVGYGAAAPVSTRAGTTARMPASPVDRGGLPPGALLLAPGERGRPLHLPAEIALRQVLLVAGSGAGKTRSQVLPNCAAIRNHSLVVTDPKSEAWQMTGGLHRAAVRFAPREPDASACFNWIPACRDEHTCTLLAAAAMQLEEDRGEQMFWRQNTHVLCTALFAHAAVTAVPTPATAYGLLEAPNVLAVLATSPARQARRAAQAFAGVKPELRASVILDVQNRLAFLDDPRVRRFTSAECSTPDFRALRQRPVAVYWCLDERDLAPLRPLSALFWTLLLNQLVASEGLPVTLLLDEFGNLGRIPHFETTISVARGRGIGIVVVAQSLGQLDAMYGQNHARTIRDDCATKITLGGGVDLETARLFAELSGETTLVIETQSRRPDRYSWFGGEEVSHSQQHVRRTLLTADEVRRLPQGSMLVVTTNRPTMVLPCFWYDAPPCPGRAAALGPEQALAVDPPRPAPPPPGLPPDLDDLPGPPRVDL